jgi:hypothetical protein
MLMVASPLLLLWGDTSLEVKFWLAILEFLPFIVQSSILFKVLLHHINVVLVILLINSGISPDQNTELMERLGYKSALFLPLGGILV